MDTRSNETKSVHFCSLMEIIHVYSSLFFVDVALISHCFVLKRHHTHYDTSDTMSLTKSLHNNNNKDASCEDEDSNKEELLVVEPTTTTTPNHSTAVLSAMKVDELVEYITDAFIGEMMGPKCTPTELGSLLFADYGRLFMEVCVSKCGASRVEILDKIIQHKILHFACRHQATSEMKEFIETLLEVWEEETSRDDYNNKNARPRFSPTHHPLLLAEDLKQEGKWLIGSKINPLHTALLVGNQDMAQFICEWMEERNTYSLLTEMLLQTDGNGWTSLHHAVDTGCWKVVQYILEKVKSFEDGSFESFLRMQDNLGNTAFHRLCIMDRVLSSGDYGRRRHHKTHDLSDWDHLHSQLVDSRQMHKTAHAFFAGASPLGLAALRELFHSLPNNNGMSCLNILQGSNTELVYGLLAQQPGQIHNMDLLRGQFMGNMDLSRFLSGRISSGGAPDAAEFQMKEVIEFFGKCRCERKRLRRMLVVLDPFYHS